MTDSVFKAPSLPPGPRRRDPPAPQEQYGLIAPSKTIDESKAEVAAETTVEPQQPAEVERAFDPPFWCKRSPHKFGFEVVKNGVIVETMELSTQDHWVLGRLPPPMVDITLDNPTVSRQHAALVFRDTGEAYIYDLGSVHGTFVNKRQIKSKTYVELRTGDQLKFGQSSRLYVLVGGPEKSETGDGEFRTRQEKRQKALASARNRRDSDSTEFIRRAKQNEDALEDDDDVVRKEYEEQDDSDAAAEERANRTREFYRKYYGDEEEDEADAFLDRTGDVEKRSRARASQAESFASLSKKHDILESLKNKLVEEINTLGKHTDTASMEGEDDLDQYMAGLAGSFDQEKKRKKEYLCRDIERELSTFRTLMELVKPTSTNPAAPKFTPIQKRQLVEFEEFWRAKKAETGDAPVAPETLETEGSFEPAPKRQKIDRLPNPGPAPCVNSPAECADAPIVTAPSTVHGVTTSAADTIRGSQTKSKHKDRTPSWEMEEDAWIPPPAQTGDARTELNATLGT
eukprot:TRINITY_DN127_c0_g1_i1.p1 TRINITY_DN127_c0_g1~~TRINITY_DN127_c0_g1_i1.p1  ORF type:complete len:532 (-),score=66.23 TRINITY_DN127_c0_g1_i1:2576-4117(-)